MKLNYYLDVDFVPEWIAENKRRFVFFLELCSLFQSEVKLLWTTLVMDCYFSSGQGVAMSSSRFDGISVVVGLSRDIFNAAGSQE